MTELRDGTILQDGLKFTPRLPSPGNKVRYIPFPVEGQITKVVPPEGDENFDQETYLCDVHITEMGIDLFQVPWMLPKAGPDNYVHFGPVAASKNFDFTPFNQSALKPKVSDGDTVVVVFIMGDVARPKIIAMLPHNQSGPNGLCPDPRPTEDDGDCFKVRFGGTSLMIDQDGNVSIKNTLTLDEVLSGEPIPAPKTFTIDLTDGAGAHTTLVMDGDTGNLTFEGSNGTTVTIDNDNDAVDILCDDGDELSVSAADGIQASTPSNGGTSLSMKDGQIDLVAGQGFSVTTQGDSYDIVSDGGDVNIKSSAGAVNIEADGGDIALKATGGAFSVEDQTGNKILLGGGKFNVTMAAGELIDTLEKEVGAFVDNATAAVLTSVGPGQLSPAIVTVLTNVRVFLNSIK